MKFDASRAESLFRELGDPRYAGPDGEHQAADFVATQFEKSGLAVERREVSGSRFPQRAAPWVGWLGYGFLVTSVYVLALQPSVPSLILSFIVSYTCFPWIFAVIGNGIRPGRLRPPLETAPVVIASLPGDARASVRVVFQAVISGLEADPFPFLIRGQAKWLLLCFLSLFPGLWCLAVLTYRGVQFMNPARVDARIGNDLLVRYVDPVFLTLVWIGIVTLLSFEHQRSRDRRGRNQTERRGLALLLEMAKTWPRTGSRSIEPVFVAAGGQQADHAGSREVVRLLDSDWASKPSLLILFFAPGAGDGLWLCSNSPSAWGLGKLAEDAARSLWLSCRANDPYALLSLWPFEKCRPACGPDRHGPACLH